MQNTLHVQEQRDRVQATRCEMAIEHVPDEFGPIILQALAAGDSPGSAEIPLSQIERFVDFADTQLHT